jgi:hypothetical protein
VGAALSVVLIVAAAGCSDDDETPSASSTTATSTTSTSVLPTTTPVADVAAQVYFVRNEQVATGGASVSGESPLRGALEALMEGPSAFEADLVMTTAIPEGTTLLGVDLSDGLATVDLSGEFASGGGSSSMLARVAQVVFTATQFDTVETVTVTLDGASVASIGGEGVDATDLTRADFPDQTPAILVETPTPGDDVTSPLVATGIANVFEATVNYEITDNDGLIVAEGFVTAAQVEVGRWSPFEISKEFTVERSGLGELIVFSISAEDGSRQDIYEVPVEMTTA